MKRTVKVYVTESEHAEIDRARGRRSVSEYVASAALEKARADLKAATPTPAPLAVPPMLTPEHEARLAAEHGADAVARYHDERAIRLRAATKDGA